MRFLCAPLSLIVPHEAVPGTDPSPLLWQASEEFRELCAVQLELLTSLLHRSAGAPILRSLLPCASITARCASPRQANMSTAAFQLVRAGADMIAFYAIGRR